jgi:predicted aspartyl protease
MRTLSSKRLGQWLALILVALAGHAVPAAERLSFQPQRGLVEVDVVLNGHAEGRFGIDTGADGVYVDRAFAEQHGLAVLDRQVRAVGFGGESIGSAVRLRSLAIGRERVYNLTAAAVDLTRLSGSDNLGVDGLIGHEVLRDFFVTVDYPGRELILQRELPPFLNDSSTARWSFDLQGHLILLNVTIDDSLTVPMALDYCASHTIVSEELAERLGLEGDSGTRGRVDRMAVGNDLVTDRVEVVVGDLSSLGRNLPGRRLQGLLGSSFLYRHKLTVDYRRKRIYVHNR